LYFFKGALGLLLLSSHFSHDTSIVRSTWYRYISRSKLCVTAQAGMVHVLWYVCYVIDLNRTYIVEAQYVIYTGRYFIAVSLVQTISRQYICTICPQHIIKNILAGTFP
jgi:hypothetical protein